jgi:hypothetical protein
MGVLRQRPQRQGRAAVLELFVRWLLAFTITQTIECLIYVRLFRIRWAVAFAASSITHPVVVFVIPKLWSLLYVRLAVELHMQLVSEATYAASCSIFAEAFAILAEALWLHSMTRMRVRYACMASLCANLASVAAGGACYVLTGWP